MIEVKDGDVKVLLEDIGEGNGPSGEPEPGEPTLLRFYVERLVNDAGWETVENASYCTQVRSTAPRSKLEWVAKTILMQVSDPLRRGESIKKLCERLSWLSDADAP